VAAQVNEKKIVKKQKTEDASSITPTNVVTDFSQPPLGPNEIKIVSWNVAGWKSITKVQFHTRREDLFVQLTK
jgi:hypothetical protein